MILMPREEAIDSFPTFPARPVNGGPLEKAVPKRGSWLWEPKYNGWRALVHIETGFMWNRHGEQLSIEKEFRPALAQLKATLDAQAFKWADCECLERRHGFGRGTIVVFDVIPEPEFRGTSYMERRGWLNAVLPEAPLNPRLWLGGSVVMPPLICPPETGWAELQEHNRGCGCEFYEGLVAKRCDAPYPVQLISPERESTCMVKHRWKF